MGICPTRQRLSLRLTAMVLAPRVLLLRLVYTLGGLIILVESVGDAGGRLHSIRGCFDSRVVYRCYGVSMDMLSTN